MFFEWLIFQLAHIFSKTNLDGLYQRRTWVKSKRATGRGIFGEKIP